MFRKKIPFGRIIPQFFFESSESDRVFNYLHDSNSIFRARRMKSENVFGRTVVAHTVYQKWLDIFPKQPETFFFDCRQLRDSENGYCLYQ